MYRVLLKTAATVVLVVIAQYSVLGIVTNKRRSLTVNAYEDLNGATRKAPKTEYGKSRKVEESWNIKHFLKSDQSVTKQDSLSSPLTESLKDANSRNAKITVVGKSVTLPRPKITLPSALSLDGLATQKKESKNGNSRIFASVLASGISRKKLHPIHQYNLDLLTNNHLSYFLLKYSKSAIDSRARKRLYSSRNEMIARLRHLIHIREMKGLSTTTLRLLLTASSNKTKKQPYDSLKLVTIKRSPKQKS
ncbi:unnamed protein product [Thelazia callipaeda]|uniref:30S ribosomal protein S15 n=1 Tax=Thelazia callipaeda TaxID=103827 RepID=A0A0N5CPV9_THECL|nr:unnamed protein product [Thelazia callipaeda]